MIVVLSYADLKKRGIKFTKQHISKLVRSRKFPAPIKFGSGQGAGNYWVESEIDEYLESLMAARDCRVVLRAAIRRRRWWKATTGRTFQTN
jgi:prophage regulatory protein